MIRVWASVVFLSLGARTAFAGMQVAAWTGRDELLARGRGEWSQVRETPRHIEPGDRFRAGANSTGARRDLQSRPSIDP